jgi:hypothetical protein
VFCQHIDFCDWNARGVGKGKDLAVELFVGIFIVLACVLLEISFSNSAVHCCQISYKPVHEVVKLVHDERYSPLFLTRKHMSSARRCVSTGYLHVSP